MKNISFPFAILIIALMVVGSLQDEQVEKEKKRGDFR
jgi:hypothetical protein